MARILIIDDEDQVRAMLRQMLERAGHVVLEASNGNMGVSLYREQPSDLIITDILMPGKDGLEIIVELRRDFPDAKIIAISGGGRTGDFDFLLIAEILGAQRTLLKPFELQTMLTAIKDLMR